MPASLSSTKTAAALRTSARVSMELLLVLVAASVARGRPLTPGELRDAFTRRGHTVPPRS